MTETLSQEEMLQKLKDLQAENQLLKKKQSKFGLTFKKYPENGEPQRLYAGEIPFLSPRPQYSVVKDTPQRGEHVLIEGDNLSALVALQATHKGKVDVIYIDPPYNTGNKDFVYNDSYVSNDDGFRHSKWLSFMERRLVLAKELLSETGVIFVSIDDNEQAALKLLMDSVFGEGNFIKNIAVVNNLKGRSDDKHFATAHESLLVYGLNESQVSIYGLGLTADQVSEYRMEDALGKFKPVGLKKTGKNSLRSDRPNMFYPIFVSPNLDEFSLASREGWYEVLPYINGEEGCWRWGRDTFMEKKDTELQASKNRSGEIVINVKMRLIADGEQRTVRPKSIWVDPSFDTGSGGRVLNNLLGKRNLFSSPKPVDFIKELIKVSSDPHAIVLDFFAGSGTTGHAVAALNAEDGGNRQCILVTNNFEQDGSPNGIARDVTAARMKAVLTGQWADGKDHDALPGNLHYYQIEFAPQENEFRAVPTWADADHALGLQTIKDRAFTKVDVSPTDYPELTDLIAEGRAALSANETTLFATWFDEMELNLGSELVESFAESALSLGAQLDKKVVFYIPSSWVDDVPDEDFFAGAQAALTYPMPYLNTVNRVIKDLKSGGYLLPLDEAPTDDSLGSEGVPTSPEDAN